MTKADKNFFFAIFLLIVSIILFINSFIYGIFTIIAAFSHLMDSDQIKKYVSSKKSENDQDKNIDYNKIDEKILTKNYKRSGFSILLKLLAVLGILGYTAYLGYTDYIG